jgi:hypothetical protein
MADEGRDGSSKSRSKGDKWIIKDPIIMLTRAAAVVGMAGTAGFAAMRAARRVVRSLGKRTPNG